MQKTINQIRNIKLNLQFLNPYKLIFREVFDKIT